GLLLANRHVDAVDRTEILVAGSFSGFVDARLIDHRVHADGRLASRTVTNDQLALTAADRDHRVDGHDAGLHRLAHGFALDDAGRNFFDGIESAFLDRTLAVERLAERVHHAAKQTLAHGHLEQLAGRAHFRTFFDLGVITQDDGTDFGLFEIEREADHTVAEVQ